jgi:septal ring factor EnvC (AmiA/AmiB activator)
VSYGDLVREEKASLTTTIKRAFALAAEMQRIHQEVNELERQEAQSPGFYRSEEELVAAVRNQRAQLDRLQGARAEISQRDQQMAELAHKAEKQGLIEGFRLLITDDPQALQPYVAEVVEDMDELKWRFTTDINRWTNA